MAFKQGNNPISRKTSPMRMSPFTKQEPSMSMDELEKMSAAQDAASKAQAQQLPQIEGPGSPDYEAKTTMTYPGGEEGADYDEEGTQDGMSRKSSPANVKGSQSDHGQSSKEFAEHEARVGTDGHGPSRKSSPLNDKLPGKGAHPHNASGDHKKDFKKPTTKKGVSRKSSPLNGEFSDAVKDKSLLKEKPATAESASKAVSDFGDKIKKQAADTKGKKTAKDAGKVDKSSREGSNKQERQKRRAERKSIRKDKTLSSSQKKIAKKESRQKQKENVRGVKK